MEENTGEYFMSPESQFEDIKFNLGFDHSPSTLLEWADTFDLIPKLLEVEEAAFLVPYYNLLTEIKRLAGIDDKDQFASFLIANRELVQKYPPDKVLELICQHSAVACATALLESGLDVDINSVYDTVMSPLHMAAHNLSYGMTKVLLDHGADTQLKLDANGFGTPLSTALSAFKCVPRSQTFLFHGFFS
ncbi:uncharacterized protein LOC110716075 [Chenopodium quinoa]|uniref:uncharacterized protein LOC110716075 n=1 Tax=Chenopodium quinoa TaxID=63459 RepID=UPI000B779637|nr:uncharacterized protein LOC110716075 [Chenopodium quinoa]